MIVLLIILETFLDSSYNKPIFALYRKEKKLLGLFQPFNCTYQSYPMIEGMRFTSYHNFEECRLYNNGIAECFYPFFGELSTDINYPNGYIPWISIYEKIETMINNYLDGFCNLLDCERLFVGISLIGCKGAVTEINYGSHRNGIVDRNNLICNSIVFNNIHDDVSNHQDIKLLKLDFLLSLGIRYHQEIKDLLTDIYG